MVHVDEQPALGQVQIECIQGEERKQDRHAKAVHKRDVGLGEQRCVTVMDHCLRAGMYLHELYDGARISLFDVLDPAT